MRLAATINFVSLSWFQFFAILVFLMRNIGQIYRSFVVVHVHWHLSFLLPCFVDIFWFIFTLLCHEIWNLLDKIRYFERMIHQLQPSSGIRILISFGKIAHTIGDLNWVAVLFTISWMLLGSENDKQQIFHNYYAVNLDSKCFHHQ